ncbi:hypothetical protein MTO96_041155, partial [Rhipicephalus appendiculatus]
QVPTCVLAGTGPSKLSQKSFITVRPTNTHRLTLDTMPWRPPTPPISKVLRPPFQRVPQRTSLLPSRNDQRSALETMSWRPPTPPISKVRRPPHQKVSKYPPRSSPGNVHRLTLETMQWRSPTPPIRKVRSRARH